MASEVGTIPCYYTSCELHSRPHYHEVSDAHGSNIIAKRPLQAILVVVETMVP